MREDEIFGILKACHEEPCGGHFADKQTGYKVLSIGHCWPTIFQDAKKFMKGCDSFQRMGQPLQSNEMPLQPQIILEPFEKWASDFVGPINPSSRQKSYILVYTDYVTKWVEEKALTRAMEKAGSDFLFEDIFFCVGIPIEIVTDGGPQFTSHMIQNLVEKYKIHHRITTPYHPQMNDKVESTNKVLEGILTKTVASHRRNWVDKLPEVLWSYITMWRNTTGLSPFELVYGKNPLFPIDFELNTLRATLQVNLDPTTTQKKMLN